MYQQICISIKFNICIVHCTDGKKRNASINQKTVAVHTHDESIVVLGPAQCVPMCPSVSQCVPMCPNVPQCVPMCPNVCPMCA